jgi:hypothetical protein
LIVSRLLDELSAAAIFVLLRVAKARRFATALNAKDIARLRPLCVGIRPP